MRSLPRAIVGAALIAGLQGCSSPSDLGSRGWASEVPVTTAALPSVVQPYQEIETVLACIQSTGAISDITFVVGPFADSTGKVNSVAAGSTGNFVPQGGSAAYVTDAIRKAGGRVVATYFGAPQVKVPAHYAVNGIFNSLDFGSPVAFDGRLAGIGPTFSRGYAQLSLSIQLDAVSTRVNRQISMIQRPVKYTQIGAGMGRDLGGLLGTGNVAFQNQERLQLEALNGPIALGVADVLMKEFPATRRACGSSVDTLLGARTASRWSASTREE